MTFPPLLKLEIVFHFMLSAATFARIRHPFQSHSQTPVESKEEEEVSRCSRQRFTREEIKRQRRRYNLYCWLAGSASQSSWCHINNPVQDYLAIE